MSAAFGRSGGSLLGVRPREEQGRRNVQARDPDHRGGSASPFGHIRCTPRTRRRIRPTALPHRPFPLGGGRPHSRRRSGSRRTCPAACSSFPVSGSSQWLAPRPDPLVVCPAFGRSSGKDAAGERTSNKMPGTASKGPYTPSDDDRPRARWKVLLAGGRQGSGQSLDSLNTAERRAGALLADMNKNPGGRPTENLYHGVTGLPPRLADIGISRMQSSCWQLGASVRLRGRPARGDRDGACGGHSGEGADQE